MRFVFSILFILSYGSSLLIGACPFCNPEVINRQLIKETEYSWVLYGLTPATEGNLLVVPKRHLTRLEELKDEEMLDLYHLIQQSQAVFQARYGLRDYLVVQKNGKNAGQTVDHIHIHVLPCPDGFDLTTVFHYRPRLTPEEMHRQVEDLKPYFLHITYPANQD